VLAIWSGLVVLIGGTLFVYGMAVVLRDRRRQRRRRRRAAARVPQPRSDVGAVRPLALPPEPIWGRRPLALPAAPARPGPLALPAGPSANQLGAMAGGYAATGDRGATGEHGATGGYGAPAAPYSPAVYGAATFVSGVPVVPGTPVLYGTPMASPPEAPPARALAPAPTSPPVSAPRPSQRFGRRARRDDCASLRARCEVLSEQARIAATVAAQSAAEAAEAHVLYVAAQREADEARQGYDALAQEAADIAAQVASLERVPSEGQQRLERETTHAAFAAYRRGDISSEQLREVFRRAEGWTPEHDRLSRRSTELRTEEAEAQRVRDAAIAAEAAAAERARGTAISARALDGEARSAAEEARNACTAAADCEQGGRPKPLGLVPRNRRHASP
jgi:hypothetical protein